MIFFPLIGAIALASLTITERIVLRKRKIKITLFQTATFFAAVLVMLPFIYFFWKLEPPALKPMNIFIFLGIVLVSLFANILSFFALKGEKVSNLEPALIMEPLFTILLAILFSFFAVNLYQRNFQVIIPAIIAGLALVFSHIKKEHLRFNKYFLAAVAGSFLFALELVMSKLILNYYSPLSFYFFRCSAVFLLSYLLFKPQFSKIQDKTKKKIFFIGSLWVLYRIIVYYGYLLFGIVFTTLIIMLGPVFVYLFARIFLKEKLNWKNIIASIIIIACILYVLI